MSGLFVPPSSSDAPGWIRKAAAAINYLLRNRAFPFGSPVDELPADPEIGQVVLDATDGNRAKVYDGTSWQSLW